MVPFEHPSTTFLTPASDNRGIPPWKMQQQQQRSQPQRTAMASVQRNGIEHRQVRSLTVDEALQYSSLSSIVPHNPDIIPLPAISSGFTSITSAPEERKTARQTLELLDRAVLNRNSKPELLDRTVRQIQRLLDPTELTEFKFKNSPGRSDLGRHDPAGSTSVKNHTSVPHLSPFAKMVFDSTDVAYRYPTPDTPGSNSIKDLHTPKHTSTALSPASAKSQRIAQNERAYESNKAIDAGSGSQQQQLSSPVVAIHLPPLSFDQSEYISFPDANSTKRKIKDIDNTSRKRKYVEFTGDVEVTVRVDNQKHMSDECLRNLQNLIGDIFEAEDQLQPDTSGVIPKEAAKYFVAGDVSDRRNEATLAPWVHSKLEASLQQVISSRRFAELPLDDLVRLQKLCETPMSSAESTDLALESDGSDGEVEDWLRRLGVAEGGLKSARTLLRIMVGGREEKQLYSEDLLQNVLNVLKTVIDSCIVPVVEARSAGSGSNIFSTASSQQKPLFNLLHQASKVMSLLAELLAKVEVAESVVTTVEFLVIRLVFVENAHTDKESALGVQKFEAFRRKATDVLTRIFARYADQRQSIVGEILTSLEKLPQSRQTARQFKLIDGKNIQLVSALIMQLVQTCGAPLDESSGSKNLLRITDVASDVEINTSDDDEEDDNKRHSQLARHTTHDAKESTEQGPVSAVQSLAAIAQPLYESASIIADYIITFFIQRALRSPKTGDQPYRNLMDIFTEDLLNVLSSTDWPAAELLLRCLLVKTISIAGSASSAAPAKGMALDILGMMGSAISDVAKYVRQLTKTVDHRESALSDFLVHLSEDYFDGKLHGQDLFGWEGPYAATLQYLRTRDLGDSQIRSARAYYLTQWAIGICNHPRSSSIDGNDAYDVSDARSGGAAPKLQSLLSDCSWPEADYDFEFVSTIQARLAYGLTILNMGFCKAFERILKIFLDSMSSEQVMVRSRSLRGVVQMLEKDPSILDRGAYVTRLILKCIGDPSSMVRDSALTLVGKCVSMKPALEDEMCKSILVCTNDAAIGVRKRSMKLLKDIYARNPRTDVKAVIADSLLQRAKDSDESVSELARQMFEEIWLSPFYKVAAAGGDTVPEKLALKEQVALIIHMIKRSATAVPVLESLLQSLLLNSSRSAPANFRVCKAMVAAMFDGLLHQEELPQSLGQQHILDTLTVFAKANAKLFTAEQLQHLQPYVGHLSNADDLLLFRAVVVIFRYVLPHICFTLGSFLGDIQTALLKNLAKFAEAELNEVVPCLWTISNALKNTAKLVRASCSISVGILRVQDGTPAGKGPGAALVRVKNYMRIAGYIGKYWDLESEHEAFREKFPWWRGRSVSGLMVELITPYAKRQQPRDMRAMALGSIGLICQTWPQHLREKQTETALLDVFDEGDAEFQNIVLLNFRDFFIRQERRWERKADTAEPSEPDSDLQRLQQAMGSGDSESAAGTIAHVFLKYILRTALASQDAYALAATEVLASISRQGVTHPKECGLALVALGTSNNRLIADTAFKEYRRLHQQYETFFEKEYMKAVQEAFVYQRDIVRDPRGATSKLYVAKLHSLFEVIRIGKGKFQKKFLKNLCAKVDFDLNKLDVSAEPPAQVEFARFIVENLAFFEYGRVDELLHTISCMEHVITGTGAGVAHAIEAELFKVETDSNGIKIGQLADSTTLQNETIGLGRLKQLASASVILSMLMGAKTFLQRAFGLGPGQQRRESKGKHIIKDLNKAPSRVNSITGDWLWGEISEIMTGLSSRDAMMRRCKEFLERLAIDDEIRVPDGDAGEDPGRFHSPSPAYDGVSQRFPGQESSMPKRKNTRANGSETPKKQRGR